MIEENEVFLKALDDVFSEKTDEYINSLSDDGYEYSESFRLSTQKIIRNYSRPHNRILRSAVKYAACAAVLIFSCGVFSNIQKTDTQIFVSEMAVSETEPTEAATTDIDEMDFEAPRTSSPITTAVQTTSPEKRETTTSATTAASAETVCTTVPPATTCQPVTYTTTVQTTAESTATDEEKHHYFSYYEAECEDEKIYYSAYKTIPDDIDCQYFATIKLIGYEYYGDEERECIHYAPAYKIYGYMYDDIIAVCENEDGVYNIYYNTDSSSESDCNNDAD